MQYEQTFNAIDNILRNEAGCSTELDYLEQTSWLLFLKYLDDLENERDMKAMLSGKQYKPIITGYMRWSQWAAPKTKEGKIDDVNVMTGPDLAKFVDEKLFPYLRDFQKTASSANTLEYKIGEIFADREFFSCFCYLPVDFVLIFSHLSGILILRGLFLLSTLSFLFVRFIFLFGRLTVIRLLFRFISRFFIIS